MVDITGIERGILSHDAVCALPKRFIRREPFAFGWGQAGDVHSHMIIAEEVATVVAASPKTATTQQVG